MTPRLLFLSSGSLFLAGHVAAQEATDTGTGTVPTGTVPDPSVAPAGPETPLDVALGFLIDGGPAIWAIAALSVLTLALILWKTWHLYRSGAWSRRPARAAVEAWESRRPGAALDQLKGRHGLRSRLARAAMQARLDHDPETAREETTRVARRLMADQQAGLRALELIATIAPLLGLLGTVLGMISAFQALQEAGSRADPALLAGGIWEALLTTAAGMAVAIPASAALTWFEAIIESARADMEDFAARIFVTDQPQELQKAEE
ncbi:MotA/TolQ/ExbB proton channel family protein [Pseudooceanicola sp. C21-150M6]|uniref:MotA/TolQ/ExbB proton channel family protein n=1 Tax=Pseudooceanicola sp. C21-150M6 TaxID=3434355 RepID=UPI003D7FB5A6